MFDYNIDICLAWLREPGRPNWESQCLGWGCYPSPSDVSRKWCHCGELAQHLTLLACLHEIDGLNVIVFSANMKTGVSVRVNVFSCSVNQTYCILPLLWRILTKVHFLWAIYFFFFSGPFNDRKFCVTYQTWVTNLQSGLYLN